jgi:DNA repair protein RadD
VQTLARRLRHIPADLFQLLVIDEAHHSNAGTWAKVLQHFGSARVLGVTATPCRSDGRGLGEHYQALVMGPTPAELTEQGFLAAARVLAPPGPSMMSLRKRMGDYDLAQAGQILQAGQALGDTLSHYRRYLDGQTAIAFCCSVAHAEAVAELFNRHGVAAASIDGTMDSSTREQLLRRSRRRPPEGPLQLPADRRRRGRAKRRRLHLAAANAIVSLHLQMIGRCLRPQPGKTAVILDHVGNVLRLGHHLEEREWSLDGVARRDREKSPSVKICPKCFAALPSAKPICPDCGHEFVAERRELVHVDGELEEITTVSRKREQARATTLQDLIQVGQRRNMKNPVGWARHVLAARETKGHWARVS